MKKNTLLRKALVMICTMALVACLSVAATIAYFTDSDSVTNTFTVGNVEITMDELDTDKDTITTDNVEYTVKDANGNEVKTIRDTANKYHLVPGMTYEKDPTIHVAEDSEDCWLFVKVENGIAAIEAQAEYKDKNDAIAQGTIAEQMAAFGWKAVAGTENIYAYEKTVGKAVDVPVFKAFKIDGEKTVNVEDGKTKPEGKEDIADYANQTVNVTAYAIQAAGFENSADAWTALKTQNGL